MLLARKCGGEHAPDALKQRLREKIRKTVVEQTIGVISAGWCENAVTRGAHPREEPD